MTLRSHSLFIIFILNLFFSINTVAQDFFVKIGADAQTVNQDTGIENIDQNDDLDFSYHIGIGIHKNFGRHDQHFFGFGVDFGQVNNDATLGLRAIDYQYEFSPNWRAGFFFGAIKLESGAAQNGFYTGLNLLREKWNNSIDIGFEIRHGNGLGRDRLPDEPGGPDLSPDIFLDFISTSVFIGWHF